VARVPIDTRLYAILDLDSLAARRLAASDVLEAWLSVGIRLVQLRAKTLTGGPLLEMVDGLVALARPGGVRVVVNDRADVAAMAGAGGVHVGQRDIAARDARAIVGSAAMVGLSTHNRDQVRDAVRQPIDYVAVGPVFRTATKVQPDPEVGLGGVAMAAREAGAVRLPVVAIGGITLETARDVVAAGADAVAVTADLLVGDPEARARAFLARLA
jgi:thiamine-phosphate pyrophosphorylase